MTNKELENKVNELEKELKEIKKKLQPNKKITFPKKYQFSENEKTILKSIDKKWKWLARDKSGLLCLYNHKPIKVSDHYMFSQGCYEIFDTFGHLFQSIQWTDDEPFEIEKAIGE